MKNRGQLRIIIMIKCIMNIVRYETSLEKLDKNKNGTKCKGTTKEYNFLGSTSCLDIETNLLYRETRIFHSGQDASGAYIASMKKIFDGRRVDDRCHWPCLTIATVCGVHVGFDLERGATGTLMLLPLEFRESELIPLCHITRGRTITLQLIHGYKRVR